MLAGEENASTEKDDRDDMRGDDPEGGAHLKPSQDMTAWYFRPTITPIVGRTP